MTAFDIFYDFFSISIFVPNIRWKTTFSRQSKWGTICTPIRMKAVDGKY